MKILADNVKTKDIVKKRGIRRGFFRWGYFLLLGAAVLVYAPIFYFYEIRGRRIF